MYSYVFKYVCQNVGDRYKTTMYTVMSLWPLSHSLCKVTSVSFEKNNYVAVIVMKV